MRLLLVFISLVLFSACSKKSEELVAAQSSEYQVVGVNDQPIMFSDTEVGGLIHFNSKEFTLCTLAFAREAFAQAASFEVQKLGDGEYDLTCLSADDHYSLDASDFSFIKGKKQVQGNGLKIELEFSLLGVRSNQYVYKGGVSLMLSNEHLEQLGIN
jgi:hypothetical protein